MFVIIAVAILAMANGQKPKPCESPKQFETRFVRWDYKHKWLQEAYMAYDEKNKRIRERQELTIDSKTDVYDILVFYNENKEFLLNLKTKECKITTPSRPFMPQGVPEGAKYLGSYVVGVVGNPNEQVNAATFDGVHRDDYFWGSVTTPSCVPLQYGIRFNKTGDGFHMTYYDFHIGIHDPNVWIPPKECM